MLSRKDKKRFLEALEEVPNVSAVCRRVGISKATIYRWREGDKQFADSMDRSLSRGRESITDLAEGVVVSRMKKGDLNAAKYWLDNNEKRYLKPRKPMPAPVPQRIIKTVRYEIVSPKERQEPPIVHLRKPDGT